MNCRRQPIFIANQMFELPTQLSSIVLEIANGSANILMNQDDDDTNREISTDECEDPSESTLTSEIEGDDLDIWQEILHLDQVCHDKTMRTTMVHLPKTRSCADTVIARPPLTNLQDPVTAIALPMLKRQKSEINILCKSDVVQALPLAKAGGDRNVPQPKAG
jgi:hypothetical protein